MLKALAKDDILIELSIHEMMRSGLTLWSFFIIIPYKELSSIYGTVNNKKNSGIDNGQAPHPLSVHSE